MPPSPPSLSTFLHLMRDPVARSRAVLVLGGTGFNFYQHYHWLKALSVAQLSDFRAVIGISGGAMCTWAYAHERQHSLVSRAQLLGPAFQKAFGYRGIAGLIHSFFTRRPLLSIDRVYKTISEFYSPTIMSQLLADFPLRNFRVAVHDHSGDRCLLADANSHPSIAASRLVLSAALPLRVGPLSLFAPDPLSWGSLFDFDFAPREARARFWRDLAAQYSGHDVYVLNLFRTGRRDSTHYIRIVPQGFPRLSQLCDAAVCLLGLPNRRFARTITSSVSLG